MSYDIELVNPITKAVLELDAPHNMKGGTYAVNGTREARLNVTYNYASHYHRIFGDGGLRSLYGKTGTESIPILKRCIDELGDDTTDNYWDSTEGNAKQALYHLLALAQLRPDGVWDGD